MQGISDNTWKYLQDLIQKLKTIRPEVWLIVILFFALILRLIYFTGLNRSDDLIHAYDAYRASNGEFYIGNYLPAERLMMIYPPAFFYKIFGINDFSLVLYPLLTSLGSIIVIFYLGKTLFNEKVGLLASFFLAIFPLNIIYSTWLMPDVPIAFFCSLAVLLFVKALKRKKQRFMQLDKGKLLFFVSGLAIGISYLHKVSGAIILLFLVPYMIYDILKKKKINFDYTFLFLGFFTVLFIEGLFYYINNGDFFTRYNTVTDYYATVRLVGLSNYPTAMLNPGYEGLFNWSNTYYVDYGLFYYFVFASFIYTLFKRNKKSVLLLSWFLFLYLYLEFGSTQLTSYAPLHKLPRHLTVLTIPALLCLSYFLIEILKDKKRKDIKKIFFIFVILLLFTTSMYYTSQKSEYIDASTYDLKEIYEFTKHFPENDIYLSGWMTGHYIRFYYGYENDSHIKELSFANISNLIENNNFFIVLNWSRCYIEYLFVEREFSQNSPKPLPDWVLMKTISGPKIDHYSKFDPEIYYVPVSYVNPQES